ncbi:hypothetical protein LRAMOSA01653 [Lichtheimia ramosa]|uniref:BZIP domain-containing protein n=1 Tax=Lichtheimia ramosa TaxID=688394 RepID=A0A077WKR1_9FUNG|nr:hypothetical protein LRAMOSA01653 [Lichtheimia ramosa]
MSTTKNRQQWPNFRPIAPSLPQSTGVIGQSALKPGIDDLEKRKWDDLVSPSMANLQIREGSIGSDNDSVYNNAVRLGVGENTQNLTAEQKQRRKEQNRAAQRAFRERKERYVKELETKIKFMEETHTTSMQAVQHENTELRDVIKRMESELLALKAAASTFNDKLDHLRQQGIDVPTFTIPDISRDPINDKNGDDGSGDDQQPAAKRIMRVPSSAVACIRDKDGVSFCERLKEEVCSSAYNQLLSEQLFDPSGSLNDTVTQHPVPIVTGLDNKGLEHDFDRFMSIMSEGVVIDPSTYSTKLVPCNQVWQRLSEHPQFDHFDLDLLCNELKKRAKCSHDGPVLEEHELDQVLRLMETSLER